MGSGSQQYCLRWNNHRSNLLNVFEELLENEAFTDVTLAMEGGASIKCHKMVLAACSSYFQNLFIDLPCKHPIVVLKDVRYSEIKAILEYMYRGEVNVGQDQLDALLRVAELLKVKGLVEENGPQSKHGEDGGRSSPTVGTSNGITGMNYDDRPTISPHSNGNPSGSGYGAMYGEPSLDANQAAGAAAAAAAARLSLPMWALAGLPIPQHPSLDHRSGLLAGVNGYEGTSYKRKRYSNHDSERDTPILRTVLGASHSQADCSQSTSMSRDDDRHAGRSNGSLGEHEMEQNETAAHGQLADAQLPDDPDGRPEGQQSQDGTSGPGTAQKPNWKRYKQYTREDMMAAIEAVRTGMSTPKASRKFGVPSRTLYEKVNSLGITTSRPFKRNAQNGTSSACFPYGIGGNVNGSIYSNRLSESESENSCATTENAAANAEPTAAEPETRADEPLPAPEENNVDHVEDLSVNRRSEQTRLTPTPTIKEETPDGAMNM